MKSRAAVAFAAGEPLKIVEIDVEPPRAGEVLVRITHTGVCHTDAFTLSGDDPEGLFLRRSDLGDAPEGDHVRLPERAATTKAMAM